MSLACFQLGACPSRRGLRGCGVSLPAHVQPKVGSAHSPTHCLPHKHVSTTCSTRHGPVPENPTGGSPVGRGHRASYGVSTGGDTLCQQRCLCKVKQESELPEGILQSSSQEGQVDNDNFSNIAVTTPVVAQTARSSLRARSRLMCTVPPRGTTRATPAYRRETSTTT